MKESNPRQQASKARHRLHRMGEMSPWSASNRHIPVSKTGRLPIGTTRSIFGRSGVNRTLVSWSQTTNSTIKLQTDNFSILWLHTKGSNLAIQGLTVPSMHRARIVWNILIFMTRTAWPRVSLVISFSFLFR